MSESEAKTFTTTWTTEPKQDAQHQADLRELRRQKQALDKLMVRVNPLPRWKGTLTEFACKVREDWRAGKIPQAKTINAALKAESALWDGPDGTPMKVPSLRELLRKQKAKTEGDPL